MVQPFVVDPRLYDVATLAQYVNPRLPTVEDVVSCVMMGEGVGTVAPVCRIFDKYLNPIALQEPPDPSDPNNVSLYVRSVSVDWNGTRDVQRQATFQFEEFGGFGQINFIRDYLRIYAGYWDEEDNLLLEVPLITCNFAVPQKSLNDSGNIHDVTGFDPSWRLMRLNFDAAYTCPSDFPLTDLLRIMLMADELPPSEGGRLPTPQPIAPPPSAGPPQAASSQGILDATAAPWAGYDPGQPSSQYRIMPNGLHYNPYANAYVDPTTFAPIDPWTGLVMTKYVAPAGAPAAPDTTFQTSDGTMVFTTETGLFGLKASYDAFMLGGGSVAIPDYNYPGMAFYDIFLKAVSQLPSGTMFRDGQSDYAIGIGYPSRYVDPPMKSWPDTWSGQGPYYAQNPAAVNNAAPSVTTVTVAQPTSLSGTPAPGKALVAERSWGTQSRLTIIPIGTYGLGEPPVDVVDPLTGGTWKQPGAVVTTDPALFTIAPVSAYAWPGGTWTTTVSLTLPNASGTVSIDALLYEQRADGTIQEIGLVYGIPKLVNSSSDGSFQISCYGNLAAFTSDAGSSLVVALTLHVQVDVRADQLPGATSITVTSSIGAVSSATPQAVAPAVVPTVTATSPNRYCASGIPLDQAMNIPGAGMVGPYYNTGLFTWNPYGGALVGMNRNTYFPIDPWTCTPMDFPGAPGTFVGFTNTCQASNGMYYNTYTGAFYRQGYPDGFEGGIQNGIPLNPIDPFTNAPLPAGVVYKSPGPGGTVLGNAECPLVTFPGDYNLATAPAAVPAVIPVTATKSGTGTPWPDPNNPGLTPSGCDYFGPGLPASRIKIPPSDLKSLGTIKFDSKMKVWDGCHQVAGMLNYYKVSFDAMGNCVTSPRPWEYFDAEGNAYQPTRTDWYYATDGMSTFKGPITLQLNDQTAWANVVKLISENNKSAPLVVRLSNHDPESEISIENAGYVMMNVIQNDQITDLDTLKLAAHIALIDGALGNMGAGFETAINPFAGNFSLISLNSWKTDEDTGQRTMEIDSVTNFYPWVETSWSIDFQSKTQKHTTERLVPL